MIMIKVKVCVLYLLYLGCAPGGPMGGPLAAGGGAAPLGGAPGGGPDRGGAVGGPKNRGMDR
jgi:hypothetical protein